MAGRETAGGFVRLLGYAVYLLAGIVALGFLANGCVAIAGGDIGSFVVGLVAAVVIGLIGQFVGGAIIASGGVIAGDE